MISRFFSVCPLLSVFALASVCVSCGKVGPEVLDPPDASTIDAEVVVPDAAPVPTASLTGTVWMPGNAPGMVPTGHEFPVFNALVYLADSKPAEIERNVYCEQCIDPPHRHVLTDHKGHFVLENLYAGDYWLIIQKGQFRLSQEITIGEDEEVELTADQTTLPSIQDYDNGMEIPRIALASGFWDHMENILTHMGINDFDVYANGGNLDSQAIGPLSQLAENYTLMQQYHIIFIPCSTQTYFSGSGLSGAPYQVLENLRQYVSDGGKLYVTDWSGEWEDNVFPEQVRFESSIDTPPAAWDGSAWNVNLFNDADGGSSYYSYHALAVDPDLNAWLHEQYGPIISQSGGYSEGTYDASDFVVEGKYDFIEELVSVQIGFEDEVPVIDVPHAFVIGDEAGTPATCTGGGAGCSVLTATFEPVGCGRVLYSTYHTTETPHQGLVPQERVLAYLIMEIGVCKSGPIVE